MTILHSSGFDSAFTTYTAIIIMCLLLILLHVFVFIIIYVENIKMQWAVRVRVCARDHRIDQMSVVVHISLDSASNESINNCNASGCQSCLHTQFFFKCIVYYCFGAAKKIEARIIELSLNRYVRDVLSWVVCRIALHLLLCSDGQYFVHLRILNGSLVIRFIVRRNAHGLANGWR